MKSYPVDEATAIWRAIMEIGSIPDVQIGIGSPVVEFDELPAREWIRPLTPLPLMGEWVAKYPAPLIESETLRDRLAGLDMLVQSSDSMIGVEFKIHPHPDQPLPSFIQGRLIKYGQAVRDLGETLKKRKSKLILLTNHGLSKNTIQRLEEAHVRSVPVGPGEPGLKSALSAVVAEMQGPNEGASS